MVGAIHTAAHTMLHAVTMQIVLEHQYAEFWLLDQKAAQLLAVHYCGM